jgi:hypothetical protein
VFIAGLGLDGGWGLDRPDVFALPIQTLPHELAGFGHGRIVVDMLALFPADLVALTSRDTWGFA